MISTTENITEVDFSKGDTGTIAISAKFNGIDGSIILQQLSDGVEKSVAQHLTQEEIADLPKIFLHMHTTKSIDVLIEQLNWLKTKMDTGMFQYAMAC